VESVAGKVRGDKGATGDTGDMGAAVSLGTYNASALDLKSYALASQTFRMIAGTNILVSSTNMPSVPAGKTGSFSLRVQQDPTGNRVMTFSGILKPYGMSPVLSTAPGSIDFLHFFY